MGDLYSELSEEDAREAGEELWLAGNSIQAANPDGPMAAAGTRLKRAAERLGYPGGGSSDE